MIQIEQLPTLKTPRLHIRALSEGDVPDLYAIFSHPKVAKFWSAPAMTEQQQARDLYTSVQTHLQNQTLYQWGIALSETNQVIGTCTLAHLDLQNRRAEIGFALHPDHWRNGFTGEAIAELIRFAFEDLQMHRIEADIDPLNTASIALIERQGFRREGLMRERWIVAGQICDSAMYGILKSDWSGSSSEQSS